ncbi:MAG: hypothetical protein JKY67_13550 [Pseudomonadales bacterium]|nr:hypothetical protein [Pseudomonadales bacterium]
MPDSHENDTQLAERAAYRSATLDIKQGADPERRCPGNRLNFEQMSSKEVAGAQGHYQQVRIKAENLILTRSDRHDPFLVYKCKQDCGDNRIRYQCTLEKRWGSQQSTDLFCTVGNDAYEWMVSDLTGTCRLLAFKGEVGLVDYFKAIIHSYMFVQRWRNWRYGNRIEVPEYIKDIGQRYESLVKGVGEVGDEDTFEATQAETGLAETGLAETMLAAMSRITQESLASGEKTSAISKELASYLAKGPLRSSSKSVVRQFSNEFIKFVEAYGEPNIQSIVLMHSIGEELEPQKLIATIYRELRSGTELPHIASHKLSTIQGEFDLHDKEIIVREMAHRILIILTKKGKMGVLMPKKMESMSLYGDGQESHQLDLPDEGDPSIALEEDDEAQLEVRVKQLLGVAMQALSETDRFIVEAMVVSKVPAKSVLNSLAKHTCMPSTIDQNLSLDQQVQRLHVYKNKILKNLRETMQPLQSTNSQEDTELSSC